MIKATNKLNYAFSVNLSHDIRQDIKYMWQPGETHHISLWLHFGKAFYL